MRKAQSQPTLIDRAARDKEEKKEKEAQEVDENGKPECVDFQMIEIGLESTNHF